jgi:hypothetical protein
MHEEPALPAALIGQEAERRAGVEDQDQVEEVGDSDDFAAAQRRRAMTRCLVAWSTSTTITIQLPTTTRP